MSDAPRYPDTDGKSLDDQVRELKDYIINLHRYIRYALNNIDVRNMTLSTAASVRKVGDIDTSVSEIIQDVDRISLSVTTKDGKVSLALNGAGGGGGTIDLTGMVTFSNLETSGQTVINADNITTGKITALDIEGVNITGSVFKSNNGIDTSPNFRELTVDEDVLSFSNLDMYGGIFQWGADYDIEGIWFYSGYNHYNFAGLNIDTSRKLNIYADNGVNITGSPITLNSKLTVGSDGSLTVEGSLYAIGNRICMRYNDADYLVTDINPWDQWMSFNYNGYSNSTLASSIYGNKIFLNSKKEIELKPYDASAGYFVMGNVNDTDGCEFRPASDSYNEIGCSSYRFKNMYSVNGVKTTSDKRLKEKISDDFSKLTEVFSQLRPVSYEYSDIKDGKMRFGFIAQEVEEALKKVGINPDKVALLQKDAIPKNSEMAKNIGDTMVYSLNYSEFVALNTKMIQDLTRQVKGIKDEIMELKGC